MEYLTADVKASCWLQTRKVVGNPVWIQTRVLYFSSSKRSIAAPHGSKVLP